MYIWTAYLSYLYDIEQKSVLLKLNETMKQYYSAHCLDLDEYKYIW